MTDIKIEKIKSLTDMPVWQEGHKLTLMVFETASKLTKEEIVLTSAMKKAALDASTDIIEAFSRTAFKEKVKFYALALKAVREIQNYILVARDLGYLNALNFDRIAEQTAVVSKLCNELIGSGKK